MGVSVALCHLCQAPTTATCRTCGNPACDLHMGGGMMCHACMRHSRRDGRDDRRPRFG
ncbi:MAG TPA: hypothetical protein VGB42_06575 [Candidatus Thermoplasmatota archaeon]